MIIEEDFGHLRVYLFGLVSAVLLGGLSSPAQDQTNGLASQWVADDYISGGSWTDRIKGTVAVVDGTPTPVAVANLFGSHKGVMRNTGTTGQGGFLIPGSNPPTGFTNYTVIVVFQATAAGPTGGNYYNDQIMFGYDIAGVGQPDWGISWGGSGSLAGEGVVAGIGRLNGDSGLQSGASPLALNTTHAAVFQMNGSNGTETLFVDGVQVGQNAGITILAPTNNNGNGMIPLLSTVNSTIGTAFIGSLAEVRVYTNATVSGTALSAYLLSLYAKSPAVSLATAGPAAAPVGGTVTLQVSISPSASQAGPFTVALTSDTPSVVSSTNVVFPKGVISENVPLLVLAVGTANITGSGTNILSSLPVAITGLPAGSPVPVTWFRADRITGVTNNGALATWPDFSGNGYNATQAAPSQDPTYVTNAMNGLPVVRFNATNSTYLSFTRPVQDDFTITCVFQSTQGLNSGNLYYQGAGLVNGEVAGVVNDFGTCLFANGTICAGTGDPDVVVNSGAGYNDGHPHIFTFTRTRTNGLVALFVDGVSMGTTVGATDSLTAPSVLVLGAQQTILNFFSGDITEVEIYNTAVSGTNQQMVEAPLFEKYKIPPPPPTGLYLQFQDGQIVLNWLPSSAASNYVILRATASGGPYTAIGTTSTTTFIDETTSPTNVFYYEVMAFGSSGASASSVAVGTDTISSRHEPLGPSSRTSPIVISEIMWKPAPRADGKNLEFLELYNSNPWYQDISGYQLTCAAMNYTFPPNTIIASNSFIVIAAAPGDMESVYGITNVLGPYDGSLKHSETLELLDEQTNVLLTVPYTDVYPWPVATAGTGHSLILSNPSYGEGDPRAWDISTFAGGSPGAADVYPASRFGNVVINEILPHSENPAVPQFVELYNHGNASNDISGFVLTDNALSNEFIIPAGTVLGPNSFISFNQAQLGFTLNGAGETLYLLSPDTARILDAVQFVAQADGVSFGRWPDGANDFYALTSRTPGTNNSPIVIGDICINELMYDPISGNDDDQYIELYNKGTNTANLAGWQFTRGVTFTFPSVTLAPNGYLVVARNMTNLFAKYPNLSSANTVGNYTGKLSHQGELVTLSMPQTLYTNTPILVAEDQVTYGTGGRWGEWSSGGGSSLELIDPHANHRLAANWADSNESQKSAWTKIRFTGTLDNGINYGSSIGYAQIGILDVGECLVDNVEVLDVNGVNYVTNSTLEAGTNGWSFQGSQVRSSLDSPGYNSTYCLHVRASDHYFNGDNSCQVAPNPNSFAAGQTATLSFEARWIHGWPEVVLRLNGGWLEATGPLPVPANLGTPGLPNSAYVANAGPAIYNVSHSPSVPAANQPAVVSVQVHDPDGVQSLTLNYRIDPSTNYTTVPLLDNGTGGDVVAGDGIFSATIPGQAANTMIAFYISAVDNLGAATRFPTLLTDNTPMRECLVMFGDGNPGGTFGVYHLWLTQANVTRWANLGNLSNEGIDCTMVEANRVIYNAQGHYQGSPVHQGYDTPDGAWCSYKWVFQDDDRFLGATSFDKIHWPGNTDDDPTYQREQLANTFLRALHVPWLNRRDVVVFVNGNRRGPFMEDAQTPNGDMVKECFPNDSGGFLFKINRWYEFAPFDSGYAMPNTVESECMILPYTTTGGAKKLARYRLIFESRRTPDSANDYTNVFALIDAASSHGKPNYVRNMENMANMENWMRVFAANHAAGNWDSFGCSSGQNLYPYIGTLGTKFSLMMFDFNIGLGIDGSYPPGEDLFTTLGSDTNMTGIWSEPTFLRMYWRALSELVSNGPLNLSISVPLMNAKYAAITANGISVEDPNLNLIPWVTQASPLVAAQINAANATSFSVNATVAVTNNLAYFTGQAPFNVDTIWINGAAYPLKWTTVTSWLVTVPLQNGTNQFSFVGADRSNQPIAGDTNIVNVVYNGPNASPVGQVVINEIMYSPPVSGAQFVELYNNSTTTTFDLSGWQIQGLAYTFPNGSIIGPTNFLILAANGQAFAGAYGATNPVFGVFSGRLVPGQILSLTEPTGDGTNVLTVAEVMYEDSLPWPTNANGTGSSLQLIDPRQDNWRVGNWASGRPTPAAGNIVQTNLPTFPPLWINELEAVNLTGITNRAGQHAPWIELYNPTTNAVSLKGLYLADNYTNFGQWPFPTNATINPGQFLVVFADGQTNLSTTNELHTSFVLPGSSGSLALSRLTTNAQWQVLDYLNYVNLGPNYSYGSFPDGQSFVRQVFAHPTPGSPNDGSSLPPPSFVPYLAAGSVYIQNFDALPDPGATSVNSANPVTINGITYSLANPFDFAFPVMASGNGGLGLSSLAGWYGLADPTASVGTRFGATDGDQTAGGQISFGLPNSANRALGLLATSTTGYTAFGLKLINGTGQTLSFLNVQFTGDVWHQSDLGKTLQFYYFLDPSATNGFSTNATAFLPALDVSFPTVAADEGGVAVDGTASLNQTNLGVTNQVIAPWEPGAALWLAWEMASPAGKSQGLGIDNLSFSASVWPSGMSSPTLGAQANGTNLLLSCPSVAGLSYQFQYTTNLNAPSWLPLGAPIPGTGSPITVTNSLATSAQCFYRLTILP
ncbi:MAG: lamin tail domain-containing protein [Limisphaerales bacterium]